MSTNPLTTDEVRNLVALNVMTGELDPEQVARFEAWVRGVRGRALREHRRRVIRLMRPGLVNRATVLADLSDHADRIERGDR